MPRSSFVDFKAVKSAITMERVLEHYGLMDSFKRSGDSLSGPCPIHKGSNPTQFRVSISKNVWNCFSECKHGGNTLDFISRMDNITIHAAALKAIAWFGLDPAAMQAASEQEADEGGEPAPENAAPKPRMAAQPPSKAESTTPNKPLKFRLDKLAHDHPYLAERGLALETIVDFGIGFCAKGMMAERIAIPIRNGAGEVVAYAGRWPGQPPDEDTSKYKLPQGFRKSLELFNIDRAVKESPDAPLVVVEGFFDAMKLHQNGCRKVVALMGSTMSAAQEQLIKEHTHRHSQVIVMLDEDEAGRAGREDIAVRLSKFVFVKVHAFEKDSQQPESLSAEELSDLSGGVR
jgi:DNA primase